MPVFLTTTMGLEFMQKKLEVFADVRITEILLHRYIKYLESVITQKVGLYRL